MKILSDDGVGVDEEDDLLVGAVVGYDADDKAGIEDRGDDRGVHLEDEADDRGVQLEDEADDRGVHLEDEADDRGVQLEDEADDRGVHLGDEADDRGNLGKEAGEEGGEEGVRIKTNAEENHTTLKLKYAATV